MTALSNFQPRRQEPTYRPGRLLSALVALPPKPVIYLAGKINRQDWRGYVLGDQYRPGSLDYTDPDLWNPNYHLDCGIFRYGGPFFASCDHGCGHALNAHATGSCFVDHKFELDELHRKVWTVNHARLRRADAIFAFIDTVDCFGTLVELGVAAELGKPVGIGIGRSISEKQVADLWMVQETALKVYRGAPAHTWHCFVEDFLLQPLQLKAKAP